MVALQIITLQKGINNLQADLVELHTQIDQLEKDQNQLSIDIATMPEPYYQLPEIVPPEVIPPDPVDLYLASQEELEVLAKIVYQEAGGIPDKAEQAAVIWCILNRVDVGQGGDTILEVATHPKQFAYYPNNPATDELKELAQDVITRWSREKSGETDVGRTLPKEYVFFTGDGEHNNFTVEWNGTDKWDWSLPSPY